jgi:hypothetical protein
LPATPSPIQVAVLSGTVYEHGPEGQQPLSGVPLDISVEYQSWPPQLTSDGQGNYRTSKAVGSAMKVRAEAGGYSHRAE